MDRNPADNPVYTRLLSIFVILVLAVVLGRALTPFGAATTPDSIDYLDVAGNIRQGHGFLATDYSLDNPGGQAFAIMRLWPPLYPYLLAASAPGQPDVASSARLSAGLLALTGMFAFLLLSAAMRWYFALVGALLLCLTLPVITIYTYAWSETLFIPLLLAAVWCALGYLQAQASANTLRHAWLAGLVLALIALAWTRYIGIAMVLLLPGVYLLGAERRRAAPAFAVAACAYGAAVGYLLAGNYLATGSITGGVRQASERTLLENAGDILQVGGAVIPSAPPVLLSVLAVAVGLALVLASHAHAAGRPGVPAQRHAALVLALAVLIYAGAILVLRTLSRFDPIDVRLLAPALVLLWLLLLVLAVRLLPARPRYLPLQVLLWFCVILLPVRGYGGFRDAIQSWRLHGTPNHTVNGQVPYMNYTRLGESSRAVRELVALAGGEAVIVIERPDIYQFLTGIRCLRLPAHIDMAAIERFNALPAGSLILLHDPGQQRELSELREAQHLVYAYHPLGEYIAVRTPIRAGAGRSETHAQAEGGVRRGARPARSRDAVQTDAPPHG